MKFHRYILLVLATGAFAAQAQTPNPILQPGHPWAFEGFALTPPQGEWASLSKTRSRAVFVQKPQSEDATLVAAVVAERFDAGFKTAEEFLAQMRQRRGRGIDGKRYEVLRHDESVEASNPWCTRYNALGTEQSSFLAGAWFVEIFGRTCWHEAAKLIIDLTISLRTRAGTEDLAIGAINAAFFDSLQLRSVEQLAADPERLRSQAQSGNASAAFRLAAMYEQGQGVAADLSQAEYWYRFAAEAGEVDAQYNLGLFYLKGRFGPRDVEQGLNWLARAADQRDAQAQFNLGLLFFQGEVVGVDFSQAYYWFHAAAANGHERAKRYLRAPLPEPFEPSAEPPLPAREQGVTQ